MEISEPRINAGDDIADLIKSVEQSFDLKFTTLELTGITTFGEFCDLIIKKIDLPHQEDCTTQQSFYKLRNATNIIKPNSEEAILPSTALTDFFYRKDRRT